MISLCRAAGVDAAQRNHFNLFLSVNALFPPFFAAAFAAAAKKDLQTGVVYRKREKDTKRWFSGNNMAALQGGRIKPNNPAYFVLPFFGRFGSRAFPLRFVFSPLAGNDGETRGAVVVLQVPGLGLFLGILFEKEITLPYGIKTENHSPWRAR